MENIENRPAYCVSVVCLHCCSHIYITERAITLPWLQTDAGLVAVDTQQNASHVKSPFVLELHPPTFFQCYSTKKWNVSLAQIRIITAAGFTRTGENRVEKSHTSIESMQVLTCLPACLGLNLDPPAVGRQHKLWSHRQYFFSSYLHHKTCNFSAKLNHC